MMNRHEGKPLIRLLECYVLAAIGRLDEAQRLALRGMEPKLAAVYDRRGTWIEIIHDEMGFPESLPTEIREVWENNLARLRGSGVATDNGGRPVPNLLQKDDDYFAVNEFLPIKYGTPGARFEDTCVDLVV